MSVHSINNNIPNSFCSRHGISLTLTVTLIAIGALAFLNHFDVLRFLPRNVAFHPATFMVACACFITAAIILCDKVCESCTDISDVTNEPIRDLSKPDKSDKTSQKKEAVKQKPIFDELLNMSGLKFLSEKDQGAVACSSRRGRDKVAYWRSRSLFQYDFSTINLAVNVNNFPAVDRYGQHGDSGYRVLRQNGLPNSFPIVIPHVIYAAAETILIRDYCQNQHFYIGQLNRQPSISVTPVREGHFGVLPAGDGSLRLIRGSTIFNPLNGNAFGIGLCAGLSEWYVLTRGVQEFYFNNAQVRGFHFVDTGLYERIIYNTQIVGNRFEVASTYIVPKERGRAHALNSKYVFTVEKRNAVSANSTRTEACPNGCESIIRATDASRRLVWETAPIHSLYSPKFFPWMRTTVLANEKWVVMSLQRLNLRGHNSLYLGVFDAETGKQVFERPIGKENQGYQICLFDDVVAVWKKELVDDQELPYVWNIPQNRPLINFDPQVIHQYRFIENIFVSKTEVWVSGLLKGAKDYTASFQCYSLKERATRN